MVFIFRVTGLQALAPRGRPTEWNLEESLTVLLARDCSRQPVKVQAR